MRMAPCPTHPLSMYCDCLASLEVDTHPVASAVNDRGTRLKLTDPDGNVTYSSSRYSAGHEANFVIFERKTPYGASGHYWDITRRKDERAVRAALRHRISGHRVVVSITRHVEPDNEKVLEIIEAARDAAAREHADPAVLEILAHAVAAAGNVAGNTHAPTCHQKENQS